MVALSGAFADILAPGFEDILFDEFDRYEDEYKKICNVIPSKKSYEKTSGVSGFITLATKNKGASITYDDSIQEYDDTFTHTTRALGFRIERELYDDDLYDKMSQMPKALGTSARNSIETVVANLYNNGFTDSSAYHGADSKPLLATDHPLAASATEQNELTTAADLSNSSLEQALTDIEDTRDYRNLHFKMIPKLLIVPPALRWDASTILESQLKSGTAYNDKNVFKDLDLVYTVNHHLTDSDAWFILCDTHFVTLYERQKPTFEADDDFDTKDAKFSVMIRNVGGWKDWRGVYGSPGG